MRKQHLGVFMLLLVFGISSTVLAQTTIKPGIGINVTDWSTSGGDTKGKVGWQIGASVAFGEKFYIEPGLFYQKQSTEASNLEDYSRSDDKFSISSLRVPVNVGLSVLGKEDSMLGLHVFGGPTMSFVLSDDLDNLGADIKNLNWGVQAGVGVNLLIFYLDASYEWGLNEFVKDVDNSPKLKGFYLTAGLKL